MKIFPIIIISFILLLTSCQKTGKVSDSGTRDIKMKYATIISLSEGDGYTAAEFRNPWDSTRILHRYVLVPKDGKMPGNLPEGDIIRTPLSHILAYVSVHAGLLNELGALDAIGSVGDAQYMEIDELQKRIRNGNVIDCGTSNAIDTERIIDLDPDAVFISAMEDNSTYSKLLSVGIPVIECADYMETGPLQRAEWMRFYGMLVGKGNEADSLFSSIEKEYNSLKDKAKDMEPKPKVVDGMRFDASWYIAGKNSTSGQLIADAGGDYIFSDEMSHGSVPYSPEVVLDKAHDADIWLFKYHDDDVLTYEEIAKQWTGYQELKAFKQHQAWGIDLGKTRYYMTAPFHPEILLRELVGIFHPGTEDTSRNIYYKPIAE